jgi:hypothetical protein
MPLPHLRFAVTPDESVLVHTPSRCVPLTLAWEAVVISAANITVARILSCMFMVVIS